MDPFVKGQSTISPFVSGPSGPHHNQKASNIIGKPSRFYTKAVDSNNTFHLGSIYCVVGCHYSDSVLSKTAIFPKKDGRKREISNESARGSSLCEANV